MWLLSRNTKDDSHGALREAKKSLRKTKSRDSEVAEVVSSLQDISQRNHFADQFYAMMSGEYKEGNV